jgi:hypothetical protein
MIAQVILYLLKQSDFIEKQYTIPAYLNYREGSQTNKTDHEISSSPFACSPFSEPVGRHAESF